MEIIEGYNTSKPYSLEYFLNASQPGLFNFFCEYLINDKGVSLDTYVKTHDEVKPVDHPKNCIGGKYNWISGAFQWDTSPQGQDFWYKLDQDWQAIVQMYHQSGAYDRIVMTRDYVETAEVECSFCEGTGKREYTLFHHHGTEDGIEQCEICEGSGIILTNV